MARTAHVEFMLDILGQALDKYGEMTTKDVSRELLVCISAARRYMRLLDGAQVYRNNRNELILTRGPIPKVKPKPKPKRTKLTSQQRLHDELLRRGSMSAEEVAEFLGVSHAWARRLMAGLQGTERYYVGGLVHFCWRGEAPKKPAKRDRYAEARQRRDENHARIKEAVERAGVLSITEAGAMLGTHRDTTARYLVDMHKAGEIVRLRSCGVWVFPAGTENPRPPNHARGVVGRVLDVIQGGAASGARCVELLPDDPPRTVRSAVQSLRERGEILPIGGGVYVAA